MQRKDADKRNEDTIALIRQEWELVLTGKSADRLVEILQNYEMDLLANPIDKNPALFEKYVWALLAAGNYMDLKFLMKRTKEVLFSIFRPNTKLCWLLSLRLGRPRIWRHFVKA